MELWNEYEGRTIDGVFPLERLIRPEGRSAFFSTTSVSGTSTVIRLIESHFDEDEIIARWNGVTDLHQPNLLNLTRFGHATMDETSLVYVVMEPTEADLSEILRERRLTLAETRQIATSLIPALQALHSKSFIHEHIQPANVLAVGEVVKLRSDCIREAPEGAEGERLRANDVRDLATLLLQALTQRQVLDASPNGQPLPAPFREIIQSSLSGRWGLAEMAAALKAEPALVPDYVRSAVPQTAPIKSELPTLAVARPIPTQTPSSRHAETTAFPESTAGRIRVPVDEQTNPARRVLAWVALAVICLVALIAWKASGRHAAPVAQSDAPTAPATAAPTTAPTTTPAPVPAAPTQADTHGSWRVVAYTYNKRPQAIEKAKSLEARYSALHPDVFTPTGRAPFLVTLGGPLNREDAFKLKAKLQGQGLPRDIYAQNYSSRSR